MIADKIQQYTYNDLVIIPSIQSRVKSRKECNVEDDLGYLPLFTAPMSSVINNDNFQLFEDCKIHSILPRTENLILRLNQCYNHFAAFSLKEFEEYFVNWNGDNKKRYALIDIANGHMSYLFDLVDKAKELNGDNLVVMIGNIANPNTYEICIIHDIDFVRCGIGSGFGCTTSTNVGVHYAPASLINKINEIKIKKRIEAYSINNQNPKLPKVIADGGIRNFSDIIKALALGADYVMCGLVFAKMFESASQLILNVSNEDYGEWCEMDDISFLLAKEDRLKQYIKDKRISKLYYGMSTKKAQLEMGKEILKTSEGVERTINVEYTMKGWVENFIDYLRSAMSYCDAFDLKHFIGNVTLAPITNNSFGIINK